MNLGLDAVYTEEEIKCALLQMAPSKAPGVDRFTTALGSSLGGRSTSRVGYLEWRNSSCGT
jgi:hypothetical protein